MNILKKIGFAIVNLILTIAYFFIFILIFALSSMPDFYGSGSEYLIQEGLFYPIIIPLFLLILGLTQYLTFKTKPDKILDAIYIEFQVLKWLTLGLSILGCFATYWFYHSGSIGAWIAMFIWFFIYFLFYLFISRITYRVSTSIEDVKHKIHWNRLFKKLDSE